MSSQTIGPVVQSFFVDYLVTMKEVRPASVQSYRDAMKLFLRFISRDTGHKLTRLTLADLSFERVLRYLR